MIVVLLQLYQCLFLGKHYLTIYIHPPTQLLYIVRVAVPLLQVQLEVNVSFVQDSLRGDDTTELRVKFVKKLEDAVPAGDD